jgi:hypothetical protein
VIKADSITVFMNRPLIAPQYRVVNIEKVLRAKFSKEQYDRYESGKKGNGWGMFEVTEHLYLMFVTYLIF